MNFPSRLEGVRRSAPTPAQFIRGRGTRLENETVVVFNDAEDTATVSTASPTVFRRLTKRGYAPDPEFGINEARTAARFILPKSKISFRSAKTATRKALRPPVFHEKPRSEGQSGEKRTPDGSLDPHYSRPAEQVDE